MTDRFGDFEILGRLGVGGMAETFVARRVREGGFVKIVALKRVLPAYGNDPTFVRMFQREARLAARLEHPNVASVYDFGITDGQWWMALELVEGIDLRGLLLDLRERGERLPIPLVVLIASDVASALMYAWERVIDGEEARIVHRDVTPSNVLLGYEGAVKLADFGVAKVALTGDATRTGSVYGKVPYMAPEQALGLAVDHRVDLFALGVTMFELLAGKRPFDGATDLDTLQRIAAGRREELGELAPDAPPQMVRIIDRLLVTAREARLESARALLQELSSFPSGVQARVQLGELVRRARPPEQLVPLRPASPVQAGRASEGFGGTPPDPYPASAALERTVPAEPRVPAVRPSSGARASSRTIPVEPLTPAAPAVAVDASAHPPRGVGRPGWVLALAALGIVACTILAMSAVLAVRWLGSLAVGAPSAGAASSRPEAAAAPSGGPFVPEVIAPEAPEVFVALEEGAPAGGAPAGEAVAPEAEAGTETVGAESVDAAAPDEGQVARDPDARLTVVVYPWGYVWIDGRARGRAPVRLFLPAGEHVIAAGPSASRSTTRRRVQLAAGETRSITLEVD